MTIFAHTDGRENAMLKALLSCFNLQVTLNRKIQKQMFIIKTKGQL
jgi:hypothetical protein